MICEIPKIESWMSHLQLRVNEAKEIGLLAKKDELILPSAVVFFPDNIEGGLRGDVQPNCPLREIQGIGTSPGWVKRYDLFDEAAQWICEKYSRSETAELFCEAGYSKLGDKVLDSRQYIIFEDKPFLNKKLLDASADMIANTLRWGQSRRLLGVVADVLANQSFADNDVNHLLFICEVFDGDSILAAEINLTGIGSS